MIESRVLDRLRQGLPAVGPVFGMFPLARTAEVIGRTGYDFLWVDLESRPVDWTQLYDIGIGCRAAGIDLVVRLAKLGYSEVMKVLMLGATGVMAPQVKTLEEAREFPQWAKYHPQGRRGFDNCGPDADFGLAGKLEYLDHVNRETFCGVWMEDASLVDCIDEVAAIDGVDLLVVGPSDLSLSYGVPLEKDHERVVAAIEKMAAAAKKHGKYWGVPFGNYAHIKEHYELGARVFFSGIDEQDLVLEGMMRNCRKFHECLEGKGEG